MNEILNQNIKVSILCLSYNHVRFLKNTLDGFVNQVVDFEFEVLIHDDASTDGSALIITEYQKKYPNLIKPIIQKENQYSKGVKIISSILLPKARGKYIALCEGDDYWIDKYKLKKQVAYMERNPDCTFCFGNALKYDLKSKEKRLMVTPENCIDRSVFKFGSSDYNVGELALLGFIPTATFIVPKKVYETIDTYDSKRNSFRGDQFIKLFSTSLGYAHFFDEIFSQYNVNHEGSTVSKWSNLSPRENETLQIRFINLTKDIDEYSNNNYSDYFKILIKKQIEDILHKPYIGILKNEEYNTVYKTFNLRKKIRFWLRCLIPYKFIVLIKRLLKI